MSLLSTSVSASFHFQQLILTTVIRDGNGNLLLTSWRVDENSGAITRLSDAQAGEVHLIDIVGGKEGFITAVKDGNGNLTLILWNVDGNGSITRLATVRSSAADLISGVTLDSFSTIDFSSFITVDP